MNEGNCRLRISELAAWVPDNSLAIVMIAYHHGENNFHKHKVAYINTACMTEILYSKIIANV